MSIAQHVQSEVHHNTGSSTSRKSAAWPANLVGVTATGPIYRTTAEIGYIPLGSALHLLQELAWRIDHPRAHVVSSLAGRVQGEVAHKSWIRISTAFTAGLVAAPTAVRLEVLRRVIAEVRASGRVDGLEPVLCAAINATWPWLTRTTTNTVLDFALAKLADSEIARRHTVPVVDPNTRTATVFGPGQLNKVDLSGWRIDRAIAGDEYLSGIPGLGPTVGDITGGLNPEDSIGWGSRGGLSPSDILGGGLGEGPGGVPGGLPSINDLPGHGGSRGGRGGDPTAGWLGGGLGEGPAGVPGGLPTINDLPGRGGANGVTGHRSLDDFANDLLGGQGSEWGHASREGSGGLFGGTPGGPFGHTGQLGMGGVESPEDGLRDISLGVGAVGTAAITIGLASGPVGWLVLGGALAVAAAGGIRIGVGIHEIIDNKPVPGDKADTKPVAPPPVDPKPDPEPDPGPDPDPDDKYPNPDPGGNAIWDDDHPGGHPNTIWDDDVSGGGVGPSRIWDDSQPGGGVGPTRVVTATVVSAPVLTGSGLRAGITQVGPATLAF